MQSLTDIWNNIILWFKNYFFNTVKNIGFVDVLDILILSFIFYFIYCFIRDRRAGKLALGLLLIMVLFVLSSALNMYALEYILQNFYQIGLIAVLIVFQPELRAALEKVGGTSFSGFKNITTDSRELSALTNEIEVICSAVSDNSINVEEGRNGWLFDPTDCDSMVSAFERMLNSSPEERTEYGKHSREIAVSRLSIDRFTKQYKDLIDSVAIP
jgi:glycosyltransferase involved in cell wall biosynthesis